MQARKYRTENLVMNLTEEETTTLSEEKPTGSVRTTEQDWIQLNKLKMSKKHRKPKLHKSSIS